MTLTNAVRRAVASVDPQQAVFDFRSMDQVSRSPWPAAISCCCC